MGLLWKSTLSLVILTNKSKFICRESADKAVTSKGGGFEYLIASSQEIAASTIQLVVASQVRADRSSNNLSLVKQASTGVKTGPKPFFHCIV